MDVRSKGCTQCIGVGGCEKYCKLHIGEALERLLNEVTLVKSDIGSYRSTVRNGKLDLIVSGHRIDAPGEETYILTSTSTMLDKSSKFNNVYNQNVVSILTEYLNSSIKFTPEYRAELLERLKEININRKLPLPFKTHKTFDVDVETSKEVKQFDLPLDHIKWTTNKQTGKLEAQLVFKNEYTSAAPKYIPMKYEDYMINFRPSKNGVYTDVGKYNPDLIRATSFGLFKPIQISDGDNKIIIDNTYLYYIASNNAITIIGKWESGDKIKGYNSVKGIEKSKAFKFIKDNLGTIRMHRKYIVPFNLTELNPIDI